MLSPTSRILCLYLSRFWDFRLKWEVRLSFLPLCHCWSSLINLLINSLAHFLFERIFTMISFLISFMNLEITEPIDSINCHLPHYFFFLSFLIKTLFSFCLSFACRTSVKCMQSLSILSHKFLRLCSLVFQTLFCVFWWKGAIALSQSSLTLSVSCFQLWCSLNSTQSCTAIFSSYISILYFFHGVYFFYLEFSTCIYSEHIPLLLPGKDAFTCTHRGSFGDWFLVIAISFEDESNCRVSSPTGRICLAS